MYKKIVFFLALFLYPVCWSCDVEKPITILTTSYNNYNWAKRYVSSIARQDYNNYKVIYIDDCSTDNTNLRLSALVKQYKLEDKFTIIRNSERKGALYNIHNTIHSSIEDDNIVVSLDGDDWFFNPNVLECINRAYSTPPETWLTHGTIIEYPKGTVSWSKEIPQAVIKENAFRSFRCPSHLRTFYAWLYKQIKLEDLIYEGNFYTMTWDMAIMYPMIEMAGERHKFINQITYVYNMSNALNDNKVDPLWQRKMDAHIRSLTPYERLKAKPLVRKTDE